MIAIEQLILEGHRLKILAVEYLLDPKAVINQLPAKEEKRRLEQHENKNLQSEKPPRLWHKVVIIVGFVLLAKSYLLLSNSTPNQETAETQKFETTIPELILKTSQSVNKAGGNCEIPDDHASDGRRCGGRAASVREGGR